jgi:hypothetical protein
MNKHTPGPWRVLPKWDERTNGRLVYANNAGNSVASALYLGGTEEATANARLIAAAPDLLAALQTSLGRMNDGHDLRHGWWLQAFPDCRARTAELRQAIDKARAAIAKATGQ